MKKIVKKQKVEREPVDVTNDAMMAAEGIRLPNLKPRDVSIWTKTPSEKAKLKQAKRRDKTKFTTRWAAQPKHTCPLVSKMIFHIIPLTKGGKTTLSISSTLYDIPRILKQYKNVMFETYSWNGKTYKRSELPFWGC